MPVRPTNTRLGRREPDLQLILGTPAAIADLTAVLDRRLADERRPNERLRMLREATNQVTRTANDAIQAYRRSRAAVSAELAMPNGDWAHAQRMSLQLDAGRREVLVALEQVSHRYAWAQPWSGAGPSQPGPITDLPLPGAPMRAAAPEG